MVPEIIKALIKAMTTNPIFTYVANQGLTMSMINSLVLFSHFMFSSTQSSVSVLDYTQKIPFSSHPVYMVVF